MKILKETGKFYLYKPIITLNIRKTYAFHSG